ncbi:MAG: cytochrome c-type biogenesis CcmF C-terminal domain-containing protein, partial [Oceanobacter sp.]
ADVWKKTRGKPLQFTSQSLSFQGMILAHIGVAVTVIGVTMVANYSLEESARMSPGSSHQLGDYRFEMIRTSAVRGPNYEADIAYISVWKDGEQITELAPEKRRYPVRGSIMTEAAIDVSLFRDVYVSMGEPLDNGAWGMRLQVKPFMRWVWLGAIFMSIGGLMATLDKRYRQTRTQTSKVGAASSTGAQA